MPTHTHTYTRWKEEARVVQDLQLPTAHPGRLHPLWLVHTPSSMGHWKTQNVRKLRLWVKRDGQMISIPFLREAIPHTMRNVQRNLLFHFQETVPLSNGHDCKCQMD